MAAVTFQLARSSLTDLYTSTIAILSLFLLLRYKINSTWLLWVEHLPVFFLHLFSTVKGPMLRSMLMILTATPALTGRYGGWFRRVS
jgi:hypothetical protein